MRYLRLAALAAAFFVLAGCEAYITKAQCFEQGGAWVFVANGGPGGVTLPTCADPEDAAGVRQG